MKVSNSSSSTSSYNTTLTSNKRMSGLISGLDTDTLVKQLTADIQNKIDKQNQNKQLAQWRQSSYREVTKALSEFQSKYFKSSTSSNNISSSDFFNSTSIKNTSTYLNVSGSATAAQNMVVSEISQLASQANFSSTHNVSNQAITTGAIYQNYAASKVSGQSITVNYGGTDYKLTVSSDLMLGDATDQNANVTAIVNDLQKQINSNSDLKDKIKIVTDGTNVTLSTVDPSDTKKIKITDGGTNLLTGLGLQKSDTAYNTVPPGAVVKDSLYSQNTLKDMLSGSSLTFSLNGLNKTIKFDDTRSSEYTDAAGLKTYLQGALDTAYGAGKVTVANTNGIISFSTGSDSTSVLTLSSSSKTGVLGMDGALRIYAGTSNRVNTNMTLDDLAETTAPGTSKYMGTLLSQPADGNYKIKVNDKEFTFKSTDTIDSIIKTINNDSTANVTLTYSNTTDKFTVTAKNGGSSSQVNISDESGNLAAVLLGQSGSDYTVKNGQDAKLKVSFDGGNSFQNITRSDNTFTMDGVNFELLGVNTKDASGNTVTPDKIKFSVNNDTDGLYKKISDFVTDYNNIVTLAYGKVIESTKTDNETFAPLTDAQKADMTESQITAWETKAKKGILQNDNLLFGLTNNFRSAMNDQVTSMQSSLYQIGITTKSDDYSKSNGQLKIDDTALKKALTDDPDKVAALFTSADGIAKKMQDVITANIKTSTVDPGLLIAKAGSDSDTVDQSTIASQITDCNNNIKTLKTRLADKQDYYYKKFTALEQYMSKMNSQSSYFSQNSSQS